MTNPDLTLAFNLPPEQAIEYLRSKGYEINFDWKKASAEAKAKSFWMANQYKYDILADVKNSLIDALEKGYTGQQFQDAVMQKLRSRGYVPEQEGITPSRLNSVFRNNVQSAYMAGNYKSLLESVDILPFWRMVVILDRRSSKICPPLKDIVARWDDPFWLTHFPPLHFFCRSTVLGMTEAQANKRGLNILSTAETADLANSHPPAAGWSHNPAKAWFDQPKKPAQALPNQPNWKDWNRSDITKLPADEFAPAPDLLPRQSTHEDALNLVCDTLGINADNPNLQVVSPVEKILLTRQLLSHAFEKRDNARERYAGYIIPTIEDAFEIYLTEYDDGTFRLRYIKPFKGKYDFFTVAQFSPDGSFFWNAFNIRNKDLNKQREGILLYGK